MIPLTAVVLGSGKIDIPMDANGKANIKNKKENKIEISCKSKTGRSFLLSEIYYEPGWKAFVNGKETKIYQTNHILRSVQIPFRNSKVVFSMIAQNGKRQGCCPEFHY